MRVVVTGGSGRAGQHVVRAVAAAGHEVINFDRVPLADLPGIFCRVDLADAGETYDAIFQFRPEGVCHLAANPSPGGQARVDVFGNNVMSAFNLLQAAADAGANRIVYASSEMATGLLTEGVVPERIPFDESERRPSPNAYALSKYISEVIADSLSLAYPSTAFVGLRINNVIPPDRYDMLQARRDDPASGKGNYWSYIDARDVGGAYLAALQGESSGHEVFLIAAADTSAELPLRELMATYYDGYARFAPGHDDRASAFDCSKIERFFGWRPQYSWRQANKEQSLTMMYRSLGRTGVQVSPLCLGAMNFGNPTPEEESLRIIDAAIDAGINFIDTANVYNRGESERIVGLGLKGGKRDQIVLATKAHGEMGSGPNERGNSRYHLIKACEDSLRRLQTDHIDLYQIHRPALDVPQDETLRALDDLVRAGKVRYIGCSTHPAWVVMEALMISEQLGIARYISEQPPYNLLDRRIENELVPLVQKYGMALIPWSPLAGGVLSGKYSDPDSVPAGSRLDRSGRDSMFGQRVTRRGVEVAQALGPIARERDLSVSQLALLWCKDQPGVTSPIIGPRTEEQLRDALGVLERQLDDADRERLDALNGPGNVVSDFHNSNNWMKTRIADD